LKRRPASPGRTMADYRPGPRPVVSARIGPTACSKAIFSMPMS
jgi:hypothetical protein